METPLQKPVYLSKSGLTKKPEWSRLAVEQTDLSLYDELFEGDPCD
jgi:hypothetical protein